MINKWDFYEAKAPFSKEISSQFLDQNGNGEKKQLRAILEYLNLRDDFINPEYLPKIGESDFRSDFPFSDYLSRSISDVLVSYFRLKRSSYFVILMVFLFVILTSIITSPILISILLSIIPIFCTFLLLRIRLLVNSVYRMLLTRDLKQTEAVLANLGSEFEVTKYPKFLLRDYKTKGKIISISKYRNK